MKINFRESLAATLIVSGVVFSSCVDSDKNFYDPNYRAQNPMGNISAPNGFDWLLFSSINLNVKVNDTFNGQYHYTVEVFDNNPVISPDATLLTKGFAKLGQDFTTELPVSNSIPMLYIRQIAPDGLASIRAYSTENGVVDCDFSTPVTTQTTRSMSTRAFTTMTTPDSEDKSIFPEVSPTNEIFDQNNFKANGSYKVTAKTTKINIWASGVSLYVTENITLSEETYLAANCKLFILPNVTVTMPQSKNNGQINCLISVGKGATLKIENDMQLDNNYKLYNQGTLTARNVTYTNSSFIYNGEKGIINISGKLTGTNGNSNMLNEGEVTATDIAVTGDSHIKNINKVTVAQLTSLNCKNGSWENEGEWTTTNMHIEGWNDYSLNKCKLIVNQLLDLHEAKIINDAGAFIKTSRLYMDNTLIEMGAKAMFTVEEQAEFRYHTKNRGFKGTGNEKALLKMKKAVATNPDNNDMIHYSGNLQIVCDDHPDSKRDQWGNIRWTMTGGAEWASESTNPVEIAKSECSEGSVTNPLPPTEPEFPTIIETANKYTLLFEDQWPLYGDYDMNDIVIQLKGLKYELDSKNKTNKVTFTVTLRAVGATKAIAAAVMLDKVPASSVNSIAYKAHKPTTFNLQNSGVEAGQSQAVIPLFDDAHKLMGKNTREFINTQSGSDNNVSNSDLPEIEITVNLTNSIEESAFNINNMNFFIITDRAQQRKEIHMPGRQPSDLANTQLFGGNDDGSTGTKYYISKENLAWGIIIPQSFKWPLEYRNIKDVYKEFESWVTSGGTENPKWYTTFDNNGTFQNNKN